MCYNGEMVIGLILYLILWVVSPIAAAILTIPLLILGIMVLHYAEKGIQQAKLKRKSSQNAI